MNARTLLDEVANPPLPALPLTKWFPNDALTFRQSTVPFAMVDMRGCHDRFVNSAFAAAFTRVRFNVVATEEEYSAYLQKGKHPRAKAIDGHPETCLCERIDGIVALIGELCVFDKLFDALEKEPTGTWASGLGYFSRQQSQKSRQYKIYRVHARRVTGFGEPLLHCALVPIEGLMISVSDVPMSVYGQPPSSLQAAIHWNGSVVIPNEEYSIARQANYIAFDRLLREALEALRQRPMDVHGKPVRDEAILRRLLEQMTAEGVEYNPMGENVENMFREESEVERKLEDLRRRLFDALVVVSILEPKIQKLLQEQVAAEFVATACNLLPVDAFARWFTPQMAQFVKVGEVPPYAQVLSQIADKQAGATFTDSGNSSACSGIMEPEKIPLKRKAPEKAPEEAYYHDCEEQWEAFEASHAQLRRTHLNQYVAFMGGKMVDAGPDGDELAEKIEPREGQALLIMKVEFKLASNEIVDDEVVYEHQIKNS